MRHIISRGLMRNHHDAEDAVQEAYFGAFNSCFSCLRNARARESMVNFDEQIHKLEFEGANPKDEATSLRS